jgi:hypothetical protein
MVNSRSSRRSVERLRIACVAIAALLGSCDTSDPSTSVTTESIAASADVDRSPNRERPSSYGLASVQDGYRLEADELAGRGGQAVGISIFRDNESFRAFDPLHGEALHIFVFDPALRFLVHEALPVDAFAGVRWPHWIASRTGDNRVVVAFNDPDGMVLLGDDVTVTEPSDFDLGHRNAEGAKYADGALTLTRDGFDFRLDVPWRGDPIYGAPAWITLVREGDLALAFDTAELVGDRTFRFDPDLRGPGEYLALVEFRLEGVSRWAVEFTIDVTADP